MLSPSALRVTLLQLLATHQHRDDTPLEDVSLAERLQTPLEAVQEQLAELACLGLVDESAAADGHRVAHVNAAGMRLADSLLSAKGASYGSQHSWPRHL